MLNKKVITVVLPTFNEEENIERLYLKLKEVFIPFLDKYEFHLIFVDNASEDNTLLKLKKLADKDKNLKIIVNIKNYGHIRSPYWGILQSYGEATIYMATDFQDPPEIIPDLIQKWENGSKVVFGKKRKTKENFLIEFLRKIYYELISTISSNTIVKNASGFGIYDNSVIKIVKKINDPYPFFRGLISELGYKIDIILFDQPKRKHGKSKNNFFTLFDYAMLGITSHSIMPLRILTFLSLCSSIFSILIAITYFGYKLIYWNKFQLGFAPLIIGIFFFFSIVLLGLSIIGEYLINFRNHLINRPIVIEKERINFDAKNN
jgi:glycosyltransferase involved in cell wall biosynthesis